ncbi:MAG TPA: tetratricopeptide repeat protein [Candidatus Binataceae bacterium]|nr:tetratricopeptide repeat protein [Candidatus Binataceae bacterium]
MTAKENINAAGQSEPVVLEESDVRPDETESRVRTWMARLLVATALVYGLTLGNEFILDDYDLIVFNHRLGDWSFIWKSLTNDSCWFIDPLYLPYSSYYRPLQNLWFAFNFHLFGLNPRGWHVAMIALHLLVVWLVFRVASLLTGDGWTGLLAAALFALMPPHAEAVSWLSAVAPPLSTAFQLGAFEFYLYCSGDSASADHRTRWLAVSIGLFAGALLSYDGAIVFPALIVAHAVILGRGGDFAAADKSDDSLAERMHVAIAAVWPYAAATMIYLAVRHSVLGFISGPNPFNLQPLSHAEALLTIPKVLSIYIALTLMPWMAAPIHPFQFVQSVASLGFFLPFAGLAVVVAGGYFVLRDCPSRRLYLFCLAWFLIALSPALHLRALFAQSIIQDRYLYLPTFGFCLFAAAAAIEFARTGEARANAVKISSIAILAVYAALLLWLQPVWRDDVSLYKRCVAKAPGVALWHRGLGKALEARGEFEGARIELENANRLSPGDGKTLYSLGQVYGRIGDRRDAARALSQWVDSMARPPVGAYVKLALADDAAGDSKGADAALDRAAAIPGGAESAAIARAQLRFLHGDKDLAERQMREVLAKYPDDPNALGVLGSMLLSEHNNEAALPLLQHAASILPDDPGYRYLTATALHRLGREREARDECAIALALAPNDRNVLALMAAIDAGGAAH